MNIDPIQNDKIIQPWSIATESPPYRRDRTWLACPDWTVLHMPCGWQHLKVTVDDCWWWYWVFYIICMYTYIYIYIIMQHVSAFVRNCWTASSWHFAHFVNLPHLVSLRLWPLQQPWSSSRPLPVHQAGLLTTRWRLAEDSVTPALLSGFLSGCHFKASSQGRLRQRRYHH